MMNRNLAIVVSNPAPAREHQYPRTWLVYASDRDTVKIHVSRDIAGQPTVADKIAV